MKLDSTAIAIVIVTFNRVKTLEYTLHAIQSLKIPAVISEIKVFVVNNNSTDNTIDMINKRNDRKIQLINLSENTGSAGGFQAGMKQAHHDRFDWVWLFNDDSRPKVNALEQCVIAIEKIADPKLGFLKVGMKNEEGLVETLYWDGVRVPKYVNPSDIPIRTDLITFDGCLISKQVFDEVGYCWSGFFMGIYEFDLCLRARDAGFSLYTLPNGLIEDEKKGSAGGSPPGGHIIIAETIFI